jgi:hypothetical protein
MDLGYYNTNTTNTNNYNDNNNRSVEYLTDELTKLIEKYDISEKRTHDIIQNNAKQITKYIKEITLYKEDNNKMKILVDHYRLVNNKLINDINIINNNNSNSSSSNVRYNIIYNENLNLISQNKQLMSDMHYRDISNLENNQLLTNKYESQLIEYENNIKSEIEMKQKYEVITYNIYCKYVLINYIMCIYV